MPQWNSYPVRSALSRFLDSRQSVVFVTTNDESRMLSVESKVFEKRNSASKIFRWDATTDIEELTGGNKGVIANLRQVIEWFEKEPPDNSGPAPHLNVNGAITNECHAPRDSILFIFDAGYFMQSQSGSANSNAVITRAIKNSIRRLQEQNKYMFLVGNNRTRIPPELENSISIIEYPNPDLNCLCGIIRRLSLSLFQDFQKTEEEQWPIPDSQTEYIAGRLRGLTESEAISVLARAIVENRRKKRDHLTDKTEFDMELIESARTEFSKNVPAIDVIIPDVNEIGKCENKAGGGHNLKKWFSSVHPAYMGEYEGDYIDMPKGAVILGMGGVGKDYTVEQLARNIGWPMIQFDIGSVHSMHHGESHRNFRNVISFAEANAPCFLVISEWEKMMGENNDGSSDNSVRSEIKATWLNWTQRRTAPVFIWGLTNSLSGMSQAMLRAGRWDKIFVMDLPDFNDRKEIFEAIMRDKRLDIEDFDLNELSRNTDGYTGAEIRSVINSAIIAKIQELGKRVDGHKVQQKHILEAIPTVAPTGKTHKAEVEKVRQFAIEGGYSFANNQTLIEI